MSLVATHRIKNAVSRSQAQPLRDQGKRSLLIDNADFHNIESVDDEDSDEDQQQHQA